jgi:hypothetical protein
MTTEADIRDYFTSSAKRHRALQLKFDCLTRIGLPDRLVLFLDGRVSFVELKAPGKKPRPSQDRVFGLIARYGHEVAVLSSLEAVDSYWERWLL